VFAERLAARVNAPIEERSRRYTLAGDVPRATLLSRTAAGRLAVPTLTVVSMGTSPRTKKGLAISLRTRHHRLLLHEALSRLGMLDPQVVKVDDVAPPRDQTALLRVAMYDGPGAAGTGPGKMEAQCSAQPDILFRRVGATEIQNGSLRNFDVLIQPGGSSRLQGTTLGTKGRAAVQRFLGGGGGYVGVCAGAYLASGSYDRSLKILDAQVVDKKNSYRGRADLWMEVTPLGREVLGDLGGRRFVQVRYHNGPVLAPAGKETVPDFAPLAVYRTEVARKRAKKGLMVGTPAIAAGRYGAGRVVTISPHPEQTAGLEGIVPRCARWVGGRSPEPPGTADGG
jgi:hypothetical protein